MIDEREKAERLNRLRTVQARKRQLEEWRVADLKREGIQLVANSEAIVKSLGEDSALQGLFLEAKAGALRRNEALIQKNRTQQTVAELRLRDAQGIEKRLDRAAGVAVEAAARQREAEELQQALDDFLTVRSASFE